MINIRIRKKWFDRSRMSEVNGANPSNYRQQSTMTTYQPSTSQHLIAIKTELLSQVEATYFHQQNVDLITTTSQT
tara:strand:- start:952 stop:1176 length:225 start_codon:yes stop_codon:yes gene_type:complete